MTHQRLPHADRVRAGKVPHQPVRQRRADHRATAEAHDGKARGHAAPIGKPLDQRGHRRDVAQPSPMPPITPQPSHSSHSWCRCTPSAPSRRPPDQHSAATTPALRGPARFEPVAEQRRRGTEHHEEQRVGPAQHGNRPVTGSGREIRPDRCVCRARLRCAHAEGARQRQPENTEAIGHADAQMDGQCRRWNRASG